MPLTVGKDYKTLKGHRPLLSISCLGKLCESILNEHLVNHCEKLNLFGDQQSAYRSGRFTIDNLVTLTEKAPQRDIWKKRNLKKKWKETSSTREKQYTL